MNDQRLSFGCILYPFQKKVLDLFDDFSPSPWSGISEMFLSIYEVIKEAMRNKDWKRICFLILMFVFCLSVALYLCIYQTETAEQILEHPFK